MSAQRSSEIPAPVAVPILPRILIGLFLALLVVGVLAGDVFENYQNGATL